MSLIETIVVGSIALFFVGVTFGLLRSIWRMVAGYAQKKPIHFNAPQKSGHASERHSSQGKRGGRHE